MMITIAALVTCLSCGLHGPLAEPKAVLIVASSGALAMIDSKSDLYDAKFAEKLSTLRKFPTSSGVSNFCLTYGFQEFASGNYSVVYPRDVLGIELLKVRADLLTAFMNNGLSFGSTFNTTSKSSEIDAAVKSLVKLDHSSPAVHSAGFDAGMVVSFNCSMLFQVAVGPDSMKPKLVQSTRDQKVLDPYVFPSEKPMSEDELTNWRQESALRPHRDYLSLYPAKDIFDSELLLVESEFWKSIAGRVSKAVRDLESIQDRYVSKFCKEVLGIDSKDLPKGLTIFSELPAKLQDAVRAQLAESVRTSSTQSRSDLSGLLNEVKVDLRYFLPTLNVTINSKNGLHGFGIAIGQERLP